MRINLLTDLSLYPLPERSQYFHQRFIAKLVHVPFIKKKKKKNVGSYPLL